MNAIASLGRRVIERVRGIGTATLMLLQVICSLPTWLGVRLFIYQMYRVGVMSLLIIVVSGLFIGAVLGLQMYSILVTFGSEAMLGAAVSLTLLRELAPVVAALLFAGRAGSALTAEIGLMKATEQLSSMEMIGVDQAAVLVAEARREVTQSAQAIAELCLIAGCPDKAAAFIAEGKSEADVRRVLCEAKAARSEATPIHSTITPEAGTGAPDRPAASPVVAAVKKLIHKE